MTKSIFEQKAMEALRQIEPHSPLWVKLIRKYVKNFTALKKENVKLRKTLKFYANPDTYHAIGFLLDPPCGDFAKDFSHDHGGSFYERAMPGKKARRALRS